MPLYTIGYEGVSPDAFFAALTQANVTKIIDVRRFPLSRKRGFSKNVLATAAQAHGISYDHQVVFGCPKEILYDYREDKDWQRYTERFLAYLGTIPAPLTDLTVQVLQESCCLLCYEADPATCHRSYVAEAVQRLSPGLQVTHLIPQKTAPLPQTIQAALWEPQQAGNVAQ